MGKKQKRRLARAHERWVRDQAAIARWHRSAARFIQRDQDAIKLQSQLDASREEIRLLREGTDRLEAKLAQERDDAEQLRNELYKARTEKAPPVIVDSGDFARAMGVLPCTKLATGNVLASEQPTQTVDVRNAPIMWPAFPGQTVEQSTVRLTFERAEVRVHELHPRTAVTGWRIPAGVVLVDMNLDLEGPL